MVQLSPLRDVIREGGSTVDGAIATLLCNGVYRGEL